MRSDYASSEQSLDRYLTEIGRIPLLSRKEEIEYGRRAFYENDPDAIGALARHNVRFVVSEAKKLQGTAGIHHERTRSTP